MKTDKYESYRQTILEAYRPDPNYKVSEWADRYRYLSNKASAEPGKWRTSRTPYLKEIMDRLSSSDSCEQVVFMKGAQIGGALSLDTRLPTPFGWTTMGEVRVGDTLFDENGKPCKVTWKSETFTQNLCFKILFSDGSSIVCDHLHKWKVWNEKKYEHRKHVVLDTPKIYETFKSKDGKRNIYAIEVQKPIQCKPKRFCVDPYLLGVFLGDGNKHTGQLYLNRQDCQEIKECFDASYKIRESSKNCVNVLIDGFCTKIGKYKFKNGKYIPREYLRASYKQRLALLQGLMDTDGNATVQGRCEFSSRCDQLAIDFCELLSSLGVKYSIYKTETNRGYLGKTLPTYRTQYRVSFTVFGLRVFRLKRKLERLPQAGRVSETKKIRIVDVQKIDTVKTACIEVDSPSHLYLCGDRMIPTHNTEAGNNWIGYVMDHAPAPMLFVQPTLEMAKRNTKQRLDPLIEESPRLQDKVVKAKSRQSGNTMFQKEFQGGILIITGANSPSGLRSMPARYIFFDECDAYPGDCDGEGSPISLAKARARTFNKRKFFLVSTPTISGMSPIESAFEDSNQYWYYVPCPHCGFEQKLIFTQLKCDDKDPGTTRYECTECHEPIYNWQKTTMLKAGRWVCENYDPKNKSMGYHLSSLYSPVGWYSWNEIMADWFEAQKSQEALRTFVNTVLGETWKEKTDVPQWSYLYERRSSYKTNKIPRRVAFLTAGVDVQKDRLELEIVGWCPQKISYSIDYRVIVGQTEDLSDDCWLQLDRMLTETWEMEKNTGRRMAIKKLAIDSGFNTQVVYSWVRKHEPSRVLAVKGQDNLNMILGSPKLVDINAKGKTIKRGVRLWPVGVGVAKTELYGWLRQPMGTEEGKEPYGYCHFPEYDAEYFKMLTAEEYVTKIVKGYKRGEWTKTRERNEALDCRVYARAAACAEGMDRFTDETWAKLEQEVYNPQTKVLSKPSKRKREKREGWL